MLDIGWSELAIVMVVAVAVMGPKDLPRVLRTLGQWAGKARRMMLGLRHDLDRLVHEAEQEQTDEEKKDESDDVS